jgi:hypothetical protein
MGHCFFINQWRKPLTQTGISMPEAFKALRVFTLNGEPTLSQLSIISTGENNGVWDKAALGIRTLFYQRYVVGSNVIPQLGKLKDTAITDLENIGKKNHYRLCL